MEVFIPAKRTINASHPWSNNNPTGVELPKNNVTEFYFTSFSCLFPIHIIKMLSI